MPHGVNRPVGAERGKGRAEEAVEAAAFAKGVNPIMYEIEE